MKPLDEHNPIFVAVLFLLATVALFLNLGLEPLHFEEPRRAIVALEMELTGNWWVPKINGEFYYNKPPIYNWLLIVLFKLFGYEEWVTRLPSVLSLIAIAVINFFFFRTRIGEKAALIVSIFWLTSADLLFYFSFQGEIDLFYTLIVYLQVLAIFYYFDKGKFWQLFLLSYLLCGLGFLTKGLPSLAFQALTIFGLLAYRKRFWTLFHPAHFAGIALLSLMLGGFFWKYSMYNDQLPYIVRLISESTNRTAVGDQSLWRSIQHLFEFPLMLLKLLSPWVILIIWARKGLTKNHLLGNPWILYSLIFIGINLPLYWLSAGTRERYLYMFLPFLFNVLAFGLNNQLSAKSLHRTLAIITSIISIGALAIPFIHQLEQIDGRIFIMLMLTLGSGFISYLLYSSRHHPVLVFAAFMLLLRIGFDLLVLPVRSEKRRHENYETYAEQVTEATQGAAVALSVPVETVYYPIPFTSDSIAYRDVKWPPYQLSYYLSSLNGAVLDNQASESSEWVLRDVQVEPTENTEEAMRVDIPSKGRSFILERRD
ncbi:MAG: glycosyltransferase family 39 protein [Cyclobacteriaceae bacterium]